jgi:hypothetical protein
MAKKCPFIWCGAAINEECTRLEAVKKKGELIEMKVPEFLKDATNVYRTKNYIVKQLIGLEYDSVEGANLCSYDTFYLRTKARDAEYENFFKARRCVNGKRLTTGLATRKYVQ